MQIYNDNYYGNGDFDFIKDTHVKDLLKSAHKAITLCELWDWFRIYEPTTNTGFMYCKTSQLDRLKLQMWKDPINENHSGSSYALIMREMEYIAKYGYNHFKLTTSY